MDDETVTDTEAKLFAARMHTLDLLLQLQVGSVRELTETITQTQEAAYAASVAREVPAIKHRIRQLAQLLAHRAKTVALIEREGALLWAEVRALGAVVELDLDASVGTAALLAQEGP